MVKYQETESLTSTNSCFRFLIGPTTNSSVTSLWGQLGAPSLAPPVICAPAKAGVWLHAQLCNHNSSFPPWNLMLNYPSNFVWDLGIYFILPVVKCYLFHRKNMERSKSVTWWNVQAMFMTRIHLRWKYFVCIYDLLQLRLLNSDFLHLQQGSPTIEAHETRDNIFYY